MFQTGPVGQLQGRDRMLVLTGHMQRASRRRDHHHLRGLGQQLRHHGVGLGQLLQVVQHEQRTAVRNMSEEPWRHPALRRHVQHLPDRGPHHLRCSRCSQRHEVHPVRETPPPARRANPTASRVLPDPPGPVNVTNRTSGEDSNAANSASSHPAHQRGRRDRQTRRRPQRLHRRELSLQTGDVQLEQVLRRGDVLQLVSTQIAQPHLAGQPQPGHQTPAVASDTSTCPP